MTAYIWHHALNRGEPPTRLYPRRTDFTSPVGPCQASGPSVSGVSYGCTMVGGHDGPHVAYGTTSGLLAVWPADHTPADPEQAAEG